MKNLNEIRKLNEGQQDFELGAMSNDDKKKFIDTVQDLYWKRKFKIDRSSVSLGKYLNMRAGNNDLAAAIKDLQNLGFKAKNWRSHKIQMESVNEATGREITLDWDMDDPREYAADWQDQGVYLDDWNKRKMEIEVSGAEKDLLKWLVDDYGLDKKDAQDVIRKGKKVKL